MLNLDERTNVTTTLSCGINNTMTIEMIRGASSKVNLLQALYFLPTGLCFPVLLLPIVNTTA
jgi:hypothetical protein